MRIYRSYICKSCRWWAYKKRTYGECRINPPISMYQGASHIYHGWPVTLENEWCSKYEQFEKEEKKDE